MALIQLKYIGELNLQALSLKAMAEHACYNTHGETHNIDDADFVRLFKTHRQADNLYTKLEKIQRVCRDFSTGNFQPYIDEYEKWAENEDTLFDPAGAN